MPQQTALKESPIEPTLSPYATHHEGAKGRLIEEPKALDRTPFQRDRDRIIHSDAFRRLQYKTQVITNGEEGDFRTRLTHSLEVAQLTRTLCRSLGLDEDLGEAIALAHDLGHPPFGHAGEMALDRCMEKFGGWRHNDQTLRIVRKLERRYCAFDGLNLTWEALEGIAKHNGPLTKPYDTAMCDDLNPTQWCGLEGQVAAIADDLAYNHHDLDDGLSTGTLQLEHVMVLPAFKRVWDEVTSIYPRAERYRHIKETVRRMIGRQVQDVLATSRMAIQKSSVQTVEEVRNYPETLIRFSDQVAQESRQLKDFLMDNMYKHYKVNRMTFKAQRTVEDLFAVFLEHRLTLPDHVQRDLPEDKTDLTARAQVVADYLSSLTDRQARLEHARLFGDENQTRF